MNFGRAIEALKAGRKASRQGWDGKGMWLVLVPEGWASIPGAIPEREHHLPWIGMFTAQGDFVPWLASQTDILAEDWMVLS